MQPLFYKITSYWGGLDGSIMFWVFLLSVFGSCAVYTNRERHRELIVRFYGHHQDKHTGLVADDSSGQGCCV